jgi:ribonuclease P protein component
LIARIKVRRDFVRAAKSGLHQATPGLLLQAYWRNEAPETAPARVGFTASRKVGNAVRRNRAKRRLRALAEQVFPCCAIPGFDYVLVCRQSAVERPFDDLAKDLRHALAATHRKWHARQARKKELRQ